MWYHPESNLSTILEGVIGEYERERDEYWSENAQMVRLREFVDLVARAVVETSDEIVLSFDGSTAPAIWESLSEVVEKVDLSGEVREKTEITLAWRVAGETEEMAGRAVALAGLALQYQPSERVLRFLRRLGRCYVAGLYPESTMVCRAVLEKAIDDAIQQVPERSSRTMRGKIESLKLNGILSTAACSDASVVWLRGNKAIHDDPDAIGQPLDTIRMTLGVLRELQPSRQ